MTAGADGKPEPRDPHDDYWGWVDDYARTMEWPQYYASGESVDKDGFVPAYYRVEGPNGPVWYVNPNSGPHPTSMHDFAMEAQSDDFRWVRRENTPWADNNRDSAEKNQNSEEN